MFRIAIVEDQEETRECLNRFVRQYAEEQGLQVEISLIADGSEIAVHYTPGFDIIFMDVEMPRLDGFAAAEAIRAVDAEVVLVFVTNMAQYAIRGYEVDALVFCLPLRHRSHFWARLRNADSTAFAGAAAGPAGTVHNTVAAAAFAAGALYFLFCAAGWDDLPVY